MTNREQLVDLAESMPIYCRISNLIGSMESGIFISEDIVTGLNSSDHVDSLRLTVRLEAREDALGLDEQTNISKLSVISTNTIESIEGMTSENIDLNDNASLDFLNSSNRFCLVSSTTMEARNWEIGDTIPLNLFYNNYEGDYFISIESLDQVSFTIVGSFSETTPNVILPYEAVREIYHNQGIEFFADSANFYLKDPLKLNQFKDEMKKLSLLPISPDGKENYSGVSLFVNDAVFISSANRLNQVIKSYLGFLPIIIATVIFIGYIISYLLIYSRKKDFSIMMLIGFSHFGAFKVLFIEQLILVLSGIVIQIIFSVLLINQNISILVITNIFFSLSFLLGGAISLWLLGRKNVMEVLSQNY